MAALASFVSLKFVGFENHSRSTSEEFKGGSNYRLPPCRHAITHTGWRR